MIRQGLMSSPISLIWKDCEAFFNVSKSVIGKRICYTIMPKIGSNFSVGAVASSTHYTNIVYTIHVNRKILATNVAFVLSWTTNEGQGNDPLDSRPYQARVLSDKLLHNTSLSIFGESIKIYRLPPPFDTKCTPGHRREKCYEECLNQKLALINRVSWSTFHREKLDMKMLTTNDITNVSLSTYINKVFYKCQASCKTPADCFTEISRTSIQELQCNVSHFSSMLPAYPHISLYAVPFLNLIEYVVQLGSCFGIWFGLSIVSFNPMKWKILHKENSTQIVIEKRSKKWKVTKTIR